MLTAVPPAFAVALAALAVWADVASACSCADRDERDRIESGEAAVVARVLGERPLDPEGYRKAYRVRVERSVGMEISGETELRVRFEQCGSPWVGRRQGFFVRRRASGLVTDGCSIVEDARLLERALTPYERPTGSGRVALLAAGRFGNARLMALDLSGRVVGYGFGRGEARGISVCPGARRVAELATAGRVVKLALRDLRSLKVVRSADLPVRVTYSGPANTALNCADPDGAAVHLAVADYVQRTRFDRIRIFRLDATGAHRVATLEGSTAAVGPTTAYVGRYGRHGAVLSVNLASGEVTRLTSARSPELLTISPDAARLAFLDEFERLRVIELADGRERTRRFRYGGVVEWLDSQRLLFRSSGTALILNPELRKLRRHPFVRMYHQAHVGGRLFGTNRYRLRSLNLESGRKRGVAQLTDRGIVALVGIPGRPAISPGTRRPPSPLSQAATGAQATSRCAPSSS